MKTRIFVMVIGCLLLCPLNSEAESLSSEEVMDRIEARYNVPGIFTRFQQTTTLKALDVIDSAEGRIFIKQPGRIRWEYDAPEKQSIITNGETLWIYRPEDNQVMTGNADTFFGEGMGGVFLSDMNAVRKHFNIKLADENVTGTYALELTRASGNIQTVSITVSSETFDVIELVTLNAYGDETRLTFLDPRFDQDLADELFEFTFPKGIEVLSLEE